MYLAISESKKTISDEIKQALGIQALSCTFLPAPAQSISQPIEKLSQVYVKVSNPSALHLDGVSRYRLEQQFAKEYEKNIIPMILSLDQGKDIFLMQDNDTGGNLMASLLYYKLIDNGVPKERLKRIIGIEKVKRGEKEYIDIYAGSFIPLSILLRILNRYRIEQKSIFLFRELDRRLMKGYRNIVALNTSIEYCYYEDYIEKQSNGVSLATYLTKWGLDEK